MPSYPYVYLVSWIHMLGKHIFNMCCLHREFGPSQEFFNYLLLARSRELCSQTFSETANAISEAFWKGLWGLERQKMERLISEICAAHSLVIRAVCWYVGNLHSLQCSVRFSARASPKLSHLTAELKTQTLSPARALQPWKFLDSHYL